MKLGYARIFVKDFDAMVKFYRDTLELPPLWHDDANGHAGFNTGDCTLILERGDGKGDGNGNRFTALSFTTAYIEGRWKELEAKQVQFTQPPTKMPWGGTLAYFRDPEGNTHGLVGEM
ncbi:MAG: VOC family protein [Planctomycetes bacterium]|nr:VOC family protein [Planctomycetota bacterium]